MALGVGHRSILATAEMKLECSLLSAGTCSVCGAVKIEHSCDLEPSEGLKVLLNERGLGGFF